MGTTRNAAVREAALKLSPKQRARLAHEMIASLEGSPEREPDWEEAWTAELERRSREIGAGTAELTDADTVFRELRRDLGALHEPRRTARKTGLGRSLRRK